MTEEVKAHLRCAIYTRKSSEEGLEQSFNSLDAQREACKAYILSQRHEGWRVLPTFYDDGGYSGGTMKRPAIQQLLADITAEKIDVVVVYKVDRLTRSLTDFAKVIEVFDTHKVSFVSVTQQFNTTSSMGRLTLNVLLSFAQFEREVAGERIRDKIAASKRKGMWMGGRVPLGYDLKDRQLVVNPREAGRVREIFRQYIRLGCVASLQEHLVNFGIKSKSRLGNRSGKTARAFSRGALYHLLKNPIYIGEVRHRGNAYPGQHHGIIPRKVFDRVQQSLRENNDARRRGQPAASPSALTGLVYDSDGNRYTPSHAVKNGKRYRYYVSQVAVRREQPSSSLPLRIPAGELEQSIISRLKKFLQDGPTLLNALGMKNESPAMQKAIIDAALSRSTGLRLQFKSGDEPRMHLRDMIQKVVVRVACFELQLSTGTLLEMLVPREEVQPQAVLKPKGLIKLTLRFTVRPAVGSTKLILPQDSESDQCRPSTAVVKAVVRGNYWREQIASGAVSGRREIALATGLDERYVGLIIKCGFIPPDMVSRILAGTSCQAGLQDLTRVPLQWPKKTVM